jgi:hypothetical protein
MNPLSIRVAAIALALELANCGSSSSENKDALAGSLFEEPLPTLVGLATVNSAGLHIDLSNREVVCGKVQDPNAEGLINIGINAPSPDVAPGTHSVAANKSPSAFMLSGLSVTKGRGGSRGASTGRRDERYRRGPSKRRDHLLRPGDDDRPTDGERRRAVAARRARARVACGAGVGGALLDIGARQRASRRAALLAPAGVSFEVVFRVLAGGLGTTRARQACRAAKTPCNRRSGYRGGATMEASRARNSTGVITHSVVRCRETFLTR